MIEFRKVLFRSWERYSTEVPIYKIQHRLYIALSNLPESVTMANLREIPNSDRLTLSQGSDIDINLVKLHSICKLLQSNTVKHPDADAFVAWVNTRVRPHFEKFPEGIRPYERAEVVG